jgi:hypothetical protein
VEPDKCDKVKSATAPSSDTIRVFFFPFISVCHAKRSNWEFVVGLIESSSIVIVTDFLSTLQAKSTWLGLLVNGGLGCSKIHVVDGAGPESGVQSHVPKGPKHPRTQSIFLSSEETPNPSPSGALSSGYPWDQVLAV